jgi:hypothetical protein
LRPPQAPASTPQPPALLTREDPDDQQAELRPHAQAARPAPEEVDVVVPAWSKPTHRAAVAVDDDITGEHFELLVNASDNPLDLFNHPYAYASIRRVNRPKA